ncbi:thiol-disulfide oxidoreductase DCC family protein [Mameliella alba]|uniref:thiol-disulfide oxidoreductase DCC family protein n=1 Tax=Mameliella alba TaxID=561184 RepID=UPI000B530A34|nr:DCC1-like thiol-disulfide oxidoreductase family protein [Mameliella alba]MBY6122471.1 DUF393 domain-containing protein [Mameliella alba]OWV39576.1 thiol-disulfide oxidoreductase [Mameliella alba]OWV54698.1 thiol-disulfide oxidoreductase [Mameliella alba]
MRLASLPPYSWRADPRVPVFDETRILVVMDGDCGLCSATARRIARLDKADRVRICTTQTALGQGLMRHFGLDPDNPDSWLMVQDGRARAGLDGAIQLFPQLHAGYAPLKALCLLPAPLRDWLYARVARNRYRIFGRGQVCALPDEALRRKLIG